MRVYVCVLGGTAGPHVWTLLSPGFYQEDVKNEINIMNQLSHVNLIQLYDAFEGKHSCTLVLE